MDKKSKVLLWVFALMIAGSVGVTFWRIMLKKDYIIEAEADCDPTLETCFIYECDPEEEECTGDPEEDIWYYKLIKRNAANIPLCDPADENCEALTCPEGEAECEMILCSEETAEEGQICNDPEQYIIDNPVEEEEEVAECDPAAVEAGDEECSALQEESAEVACEEGDAECEEGLEENPTKVEEVENENLPLE